MLSSPLRLHPPISPRRAPSPSMSPGGRRTRTSGTTDESHLRDLSPDTTLRAFTQRPMPYDTSREEYKIFACIETLTPAERDLGARVAKAAQRLRHWGEEMEQWAWSGSFQPPSEEYRKQRRKSLEMRIREHFKGADIPDALPDLEYWGSLLSVEVEAHEARLDEISDELIALDIEELKGHVLDMHPGSRSRPSSAGFDASRDSYKPLDDFNFLITQTLLSALPNHFQLKERLNTWTARVTVLREAPRYLDDLKTAQKAMRMGWEALDPPQDTSDTAFTNWKSMVDTISDVMRGKVSDLGRHLDRMLDTLEGREDSLPDSWIDTFEGVEADFGKWANDSRRKIIEFDVRRTTTNPEATVRGGNKAPSGPITYSEPVTPDSGYSKQPADIVEGIVSQQRSVTAFKTHPHKEPRRPTDPALYDAQEQAEAQLESPTEESFFEEGDTVVHNDVEEGASLESVADSESSVVVSTAKQDSAAEDRPQTPQSRRESIESTASYISMLSSPASVIEESPSIRSKTERAAKAPRPALNSAMTKRRPATKPKELATGSAPWPPTQFAHKPATSADDLERKISDILTTIPAHIRLTSSSAVDAREPKSVRGVTTKGSRGYLRAARSISGMKSPEITLSPVKQDLDSASAHSGRKSTAAMRSDNDIKLYHLTQPGKEQPIKLFIRRVGENGERVMVRVGGGWADLGEYLRQYAEHHGRRTASDGKFEILGLQVPNEASPGRPESAMSRRDRRVSGGTQLGSPNTTPIKSTGVGITKEQASPPMSSYTPAQTSSGETSAPSTGSSKHSWQGNEAGLAGPTRKKLELSSDKLEWIEGMMKQARTVSGNVPTTNPQNDRVESRSESRAGSRKTESRNEGKIAAKKSQPDFGDLGKVGGTKRIFMRGGALGEH